MVVDADLGAAQTREVAFGLVSAGLIVRVGFAVVDALGQESGVQRIPMNGFVGMDHAAGRNTAGNRCQRSVPGQPTVRTMPSPIEGSAENIGWAFIL